MKRCIFHYPHPIVNQPGKGSALRPNKMRAAFERIGYQVDEVTGYGAERKEKIRKIKENIKAGVKYDFLYSESVNIPTILSEKNHIPKYPFLDFSFFRFCGKRNIPVGLFYRDMHWKFPMYREDLPWWKAAITIPLFRYDLRMYKKRVDVLYIASDPVREYLPDHYSLLLPPGGEQTLAMQKEERSENDGVLRVFYVGSVTGGVYNLTAFCKAVCAVEGVILTICTAEDQWKEAKEKYAPYLCDRISVVHKVSAQLEPHYREADVFCCCLGVNEYTRLAMPIKVFEAIGYGVPVMITEGIAADEIIDRDGCGWKVKNTSEEFEKLLRYLKDHPEEVKEKTECVVAAAPKHTWASRAQQVADDLTALKKEKRK